MAEIITDQSGMKHEVASNSKANVGVALGSVGTGLGVLSAIGSGLLAGMRGGHRGGCGHRSEEELYNERKENADFITLTKQYYEGKIEENNKIDTSFFQLYKFNVDNSFGLYKNMVDNNFQLYKQGRDDKDILNEKISQLQSKVDVMAAVRPYQDALINSQIEKNAILADYNLSKRTCRMIEGQLVLPNTPVVSGYGSYYPTCITV